MFLKPPPGVEPAALPASSPVLMPPAGVVAVALALLAPFFLYFSTATSMVAIWNSSETFTHGYVILPISLWLIWRRRAWFRQLPPRPWLPGLVLVAGAGAAWLAGRLGDVQVVMQYAFVSMFPLAALTLLGPRLAAKFTFPLLFLLFAVPFGEVFVGPLIEYTADFTVWAVQATGIPVLRNGTRFELPTGSWSVVEACSGIRYLISSITLGSLYAYLTYRSNLRRAVFIGLSIVVPIVANWLRAYGIVMIGHMSGMELATGVDHLVYGWVFFGVIMFIMFWIGSYWREDEEPAMAAPAAPAAAAAGTTRPAAAQARPAAPRALVGMAVAVVALAAVWPALAALGERVNHDPRPVALAPSVGWQQAAPFADWQPAYLEPRAGFSGVYRDAAAPVALHLLYYRNQDKASSLISSVNRLAGRKDPWHPTSTTRRTEPFAGQQVALRETVMQGPSGRMLVWHWMWSGGHYTASDYAGKLWQVQSRLFMHGDDGAAILLATPYEEDRERARGALRAFLAANGGAIDAALASARQRP